MPNRFISPNSGANRCVCISTTGVAVDDFFNLTAEFSSFRQAGGLSDLIFHTCKCHFFSSSCDKSKDDVSRMPRFVRVSPAVVRYGRRPARP